MFQEEKFAGMLLALQGETVIQEPRVSREVYLCGILK